jgi:hypothetical protein
LSGPLLAADGMRGFTALIRNWSCPEIARRGRSRAGGIRSLTCGAARRGP